MTEFFSVFGAFALLVIAIAVPEPKHDNNESPSRIQSGHTHEAKSNVSAPVESEAVTQASSGNEQVSQLTFVYVPR